MRRLLDDTRYAVHGERVVVTPPAWLYSEVEDAVRVARTLSRIVRSEVNVQVLQRRRALEEDKENIRPREG